MLSLVVTTKKVVFKLELRRKFTVIEGDSGTGKTWLKTLVSLQSRLSRSTQISCSLPVITVEELGVRDPLSELAKIGECVLIMDEGDELYVRPIQPFLEGALKLPVYTVFCTRDTFTLDIPYSCDEVYVIHSSGKYKVLEKKYNKPVNTCHNLNVIVTEDSNSGLELFEQLKLNCDIETAKGRNNIRKKYKEYPRGSTFVFDAACFGSQLRFLYPAAVCGDIDLVAPESIEEMLLKSSLFNGIKFVQDALNNPDSAGANDYLTWEQYYTDVLDRAMRDAGSDGYTKKKLSKCFYTSCCEQKAVCDLKRNNVRDKVSDIFINSGLGYLTQLEQEIRKYINLKDIEDFKKSIPPSRLKKDYIKDLAELYYKHKKEETK